MKDLPSGIRVYIHVMAYKGSTNGQPFTVTHRTEGVRDEVLNLTAILLKEKRTSVQLLWSPPLAERYKGKELEYEVIYSDATHWRMPEDLEPGHGRFRRNLITGRSIRAHFY